MKKMLKCITKYASITSRINSISNTGKRKYAFAFTINFFPWLSDVCQLLNITYISLIVDSPVLELYSNAISNSVNKIFLLIKCF